MMEKRILLAEDDYLCCMSMKEVLQIFGYCVTTVKNGVEAVNVFEKSRQNEYEAIFIDSRMPVMNGYEAVKNIRNMLRLDAKVIPIFLCSGNCYEEEYYIAKKVGATDCVQKPVTPRMIEKLLVSNFSYNIS